MCAIFLVRDGGADSQSHHMYYIIAYYELPFFPNNDQTQRASDFSANPTMPIESSTLLCVPEEEGVVP